MRNDFNVICKSICKDFTKAIRGISGLQTLCKCEISSWLIDLSGLPSNNRAVFPSSPPHLFMSCIRKFCSFLFLLLAPWHFTQLYSILILLSFPLSRTDAKQDCRERTNWCHICRAQEPVKRNAKQIKPLKCTNCSLGRGNQGWLKLSTGTLCNLQDDISHRFVTEEAKCRTTCYKLCQKVPGHHLGS